MIHEQRSSLAAHESIRNLYASKTQTSEGESQIIENFKSSFANDDENSRMHPMSFPPRADLTPHPTRCRMKREKGKEKLSLSGKGRKWKKAGKSRPAA